MITVVLLASYSRSVEIKLRIADNTYKRKIKDIYPISPSTIHVAYFQSLKIEQKKWGEISGKFVYSQLISIHDDLTRFYTYDSLTS